ncbi:DNA-3-methyladenine glycosylase family protein [Pinibacter aurantiacus]|uniref:DNA-3-methyladenine glycosylase II n=1 Tax=Pinibacter aurantiacus TaxID=2851599 RepID=A0A9E2SAG5_9BACT|nr:DNA-3-methyladenine glycosylase 2 family protein [Pinibacter aurantiacus]MBV4357684.1 DNA-3-methyladenine glycosylase 2 family protein [Pinibacter aurantiacus]
MYPTFTTGNFKKICKQLALMDEDLKLVLDTYGYPPLWSRPNTFESLVHIILEQQVSLASALAALNKLKEKIKDITPEGVLLLTDEELKASYFSRQKTIYVRHLAEAIQNRKLDLLALEKLSDDEVRERLTKLKGVGDWTVDVYLIFILHRADVFPMGDLAAVNALKQIKKLPKDTSREELAAIVSNWQPYRTVATMVLWHWYLSVRKKN